MATRQSGVVSHRMGAREGMAAAARQSETSERPHVFLRERVQADGCPRYIIIISYHFLYRTETCVK